MRRLLCCSMVLFVVQTLSSLQSTELKCVKMLTKLKAFKGKNEKLQLELNEAYLLADERVHEAQRLAENEMRDLIGRLNDVEAQNGQLIDENSIMRESAMFTAQVVSPISCLLINRPTTIAYFTV